MGISWFWWDAYLTLPSDKPVTTSSAAGGITMTSQRGHAEDCPGCEWSALLPEDIACFETNSVTRPNHRRLEFPMKPKSTINRWYAGVAAAGVLAIPGTLEGQLVGPVGLLSVFTAFVAFALWHWCAHTARHLHCPWCTERAIRQHDDKMWAWRAEQLEVWQERRSVHHSWPCPVCGQVLCVDHVAGLRGALTARKKLSSTARGH
jgi:hypothetical protein